MQNWEIKKLCELGDIVGGATPSTNRDDYYNGEIAWLTPKDLAGYNSRYISRGERSITMLGLDSCSAKILPKGSILFTSRAPIGYIAIAQNDICTNQGFKSIVPNADNDSMFLYYLLQYNKAKIEAMGSGTTFKEVSGAVMKNIEVLVPNLEEQKKISAILSSIDDKIELNNRINKNLEAQAQTIFNEWFFRKDTQNNWGVLGDIADINPSRKLSKGTVARYIEMSNLASTTAFPLGWEKKPYSGGVKFQNGDTLLARITPCLENGKGAYINFLQEGEIAFGSTEYIVITGKKGYCNEFFYFLIRYLDFQLYAAKSMTGSSGRQRVSADSIASYKMPIPSLELCEKFHEIAEQVMTSNCNRSLENRTLSKLRDTLLPKLMSGEIQIPQEV